MLLRLILFFQHWSLRWWMASVKAFVGQVFFLFFFIRSTSQDMWQTRKKGESVQLHQLINVKCKVEMRFCKNFRHLISLKYCRCLESKWSRRIEFWESAQFKTRQSAESVSLPQLSCPTKKNIVLYDLKSNGVQIIGKKHTLHSSRYLFFLLYVKIIFRSR